jgi:hypothetical protein
MTPRIRIALIVVVVAAAVGFVVALALWDRAHPLRLLRPDRVVTAGVGTVASKGRVGRDLSAAETAELCRLLAAAMKTEPVDSGGFVRVELMTMDYGRVEVEDLSGPGARTAFFVGTLDEQRCTVRSAALADLLVRLGKSLATDAPR